MLSGRTIARRFALSAPSGWHVPGATSWSAHDTRLDAPVVLLVADSDGTDGIDDTLAALTRARGVRDPRLARIVDVGVADIPTTDSAAEGSRRAYVAVAIPPDPTAAEILGSRILPAVLARLLVRGASEALDAASAAGLTHGSLSADTLGVTRRGRVILAGAGLLGSRILPAVLARLLVRGASEALDAAFAAGLTHGSLSADTLGVTRRGRVILAGAGLLGSFGGDTQESDASDAQALAMIFVRAVLGSDLEDADDTTLPQELTRSERRLVHRAVRGRFPASVAALLADLGPAEGATLSAIRTQLRTLQRIAPPAPEELPAETAPVLDVLPAGATREELDEWELERLLEAQEAEELPTITEAILDLLHRRFPRSTRITSYLEAAHARALQRPRVSGTLWTGLSLLLLVSVLAYVAMNVFRAPYVPTFDLKNPPPQTYPTFTFSPSPTDVTPTP